MTPRFRTAFLVFLFLFLVSAPQLRATVTFNFAHIADGSDSNGVWTTDFSIVSTSSVTANCTIAIWADSGAPLSLATSLGTNSTFMFSVPPSGTFELTTSGMGVGGKVTGGFVTGSCDNPVTAGDIYTYTTASGGQIAQVGVVNQFPSNLLIAEANFLTGIAIVNTNATSGLTVTLTVFDLNGNVVGTKVLTLNPFSHVAFNLNQEITLTSTFAGSVQIAASSPNMLAIALGFQPNKIGFSASAIPSITNVALPSTLSGTYAVITGPDIGAMGAITLTGIAPFDTGKFVGTINITFKGATNSAPVLIEFDPEVSPAFLGLEFTATVPPFTNGGIGSAGVSSLASGSSFIISIYDEFNTNWVVATLKL